MSQFGLYIHIPFCNKRCGYCDFATVEGQSHLIDSYVDTLIEEIKFFKGTSIDTIFVGGGTPTTLSADQVKKLFSFIHKNLDTQSLKEFTFEANPESATIPLMKVYQEVGANRMSLGLQAVQSKHLKRLERLHSWEEFLMAYDGAREVGFKNINVDLMFGLPDQTLPEWRESVLTLYDLGPEHLSLYALKVEPGTPFYRQNIGVDHDLQADMYLWASECLVQSGYQHYEISNFAKSGYQCLHNLKYWKNLPTIGVGVSAASFLAGQRSTNSRSLQEYLKGNLSKDHIELDDQERVKENLMLQLRTHEGVDWNALKKLNIPLSQTFLQNDWAILKKGRYQLTPKGWLVSNQLFQFFV